MTQNFNYYFRILSPSWEERREIFFLGGVGGRGFIEKEKDSMIGQKSYESTILWSHPCGTCRRLNSCFMLPEGTVTKLESVKGGFCIAGGRVRGRLLARSSESTYSSSLEPNLQEKGGNPGSTKLSSRSSVSCWKPRRIRSTINTRFLINGIGIYSTLEDTSNPSQESLKIAKWIMQHIRFFYRKICNIFNTRKYHVNQNIGQTQKIKRLSWGLFTRAEHII